MRIDTGCDSSAAFKALVSPPPVLSAETRSFEDVVAGKTNLYFNCNCSAYAKVTPDHVRATRGDIAQLFPQLPKCSCGGSSQFHSSHTSHWQQFFDAAWPWVKASDERAMEHSSRNIFGLVREPPVCVPSNTRSQGSLTNVTAGCAYMSGDGHSN
jgi:hypothetical protein